MRIFVITLLIASILCSVNSDAESTADALERDKNLLRNAFEEPLRIELLEAGLTPRNADIAAQHALDELIECWTSERNLPTSVEEDTFVVHLGGKAIVTHRTPCMSEFLAGVGELTR